MQILWCPVMHPLLLPIFTSCYWGWTGTPELFFNVFIVWGLACYTCSFISDLCSWTQIDTLFALSLYISTLTHVVPLAERRHAFPVSQRKPAAIFSFQQCLVTPFQLLLLSVMKTPCMSCQETRKPSRNSIDFFFLYIYKNRNTSYY